MLLSDQLVTGHISLLLLEEVGQTGQLGILQALGSKFLSS